MHRLLKWLQVLHEPNEIVEIRCIDKDMPLSGYFRADSPAIAQELARFPNRTFYQTMNVVNPDCYSRQQHERILRKVPTTSDGDIESYGWLLIDCDPIRPSGISATNAEKTYAAETAGRVIKYLNSVGFSRPVCADSGNGYHLLYKVRMENNEDNEKLIKRFLIALGLLFNNDKVKIDEVNFNPSRITKLYGTLSTKGANTEDRPHRFSKILRNTPDVVELTPKDLIAKVAAEFPEEQRQTSGNWNAPRRGTFNIDDFINRHGIAIRNRTSAGGTIKYVLECCPFDSSHTAPDAAVFQYADGSFGFKCLHNSCSDRHWKEFRRFYDPDAYSKESHQIQIPSADLTREDIKLIHDSKVNPQPTLPYMLDIADIGIYDRSKIIVIKSGIGLIDKKIGGFNKGELTVWSGGNGSGKSTIISQIGLYAASSNHKVAIFSGELMPERVKEWLYLQAAGKDNVQHCDCSEDRWMLKEGVSKWLDDKLRGNIVIYNNDAGNQFKKVVDAIRKWASTCEADVVIIDNLMALGIETSRDTNEVQSMVIKELSRMAKELNVHVHFICHPRKAFGFLRKDDISGTADLTNMADNVIMIHRINADYQKKVYEFYERDKVPTADQGYGNVLEIMKNRDLGVTDELIPLFFDPSCKTMTDIKGGKIPYGWIGEDDDPDFIEIKENGGDIPWLNESAF